MSLHDWNGRLGWEGMHFLWIAELIRFLKPRLPEDFRAYVGSAPFLAIGRPPQGRPDVDIRRWSESDEPAIEDHQGEGAGLDSSEPDEEIGVATLDPNTAVMIERHGRLIAAVEIISPRNKDRPSARTAAVSRYLDYLLNGANLTVIDIHRHPIEFSFADAIAASLQIEQPNVPGPMAVSYRVGEPISGGGRLFAIWRRPMIIGEPLPTITLPLTRLRGVDLDLNLTYSLAASDNYQDV